MEKRPLLPLNRRERFPWRLVVNRPTHGGPGRKPTSRKGPFAFTAINKVRGWNRGATQGPSATPLKSPTTTLFPTSPPKRVRAVRDRPPGRPGYLLEWPGSVVWKSTPASNPLGPHAPPDRDLTSFRTTFGTSARLEVHVWQRKRQIHPPNPSPAYPSPEGGAGWRLAYRSVPWPFSCFVISSVNVHPPLLRRYSHAPPPAVTSKSANLRCYSLPPPLPCEAGYHASLVSDVGKCCRPSRVCAHGNPLARPLLAARAISSPVGCVWCNLNSGANPSAGSQFPRIAPTLPATTLGKSFSSCVLIMRRKQCAKWRPW